MQKPLVAWHSDEDHPKLVWRAKLDNRYLVEVHRSGKNSARLCIFDHKKNSRLIACWNVTLSYGAAFGPDTADVAEWQEKVSSFINHAYLHRKKQK